MPDFDHYWGISKLKQLLRQGWVNNVSLSSIESVADHSFGVAYFSYIFSMWENDLRQDRDFEKLTRDPRDYTVIGLMHDIGEPYYADIDKNFTELVPEIKNLKIKAEERGYKKVNDFWSKKSFNLSEALDTMYLGNLDGESRRFIEIVDKIELHWQTITYYRQGWISKLNADPFIKSTYNFIEKNNDEFLFIKELFAENLIIEDTEKLI
jgi:5'-deoxynucleotidase YfbR-like HD superfamily hydrolase